MVESTALLSLDPHINQSINQSCIEPVYINTQGTSLQQSCVEVAFAMLQQTVAPFTFE